MSTLLNMPCYVCGKPAVRFYVQKRKPFYPSPLPVKFHFARCPDHLVKDSDPDWVDEVPADEWAISQVHSE